MLGMYGGQYGELNDYDAPPVLERSAAAAVAGRRRSSLQRQQQQEQEQPGGGRNQRTSEMSLDLCDLQDIRENYSVRTFSSDLSLTGWNNNDDDENGGGGGGGSRCSFDQRSCTDLTDTVIVGPISRLSLWNDSSCTVQGSDRPPNNNNINNNNNNNRRWRMSGSLDLDDIPEQSEESSTAFSQQTLVSSTVRRRDGDVGDNNDDNDNIEDSICFDRSSSDCSQQQQQQQQEQHPKRVHFARSTNLEDIREFEKPDLEDHHLLYYMGQEIQKMMDDFKAEEKIERTVVR